MHHEKSCVFICFLLKCIMVISLEMKTKVEMFMLNALLCHLCIHFAYFCWFWIFLALRGLYIFNTFLMILKLTSRADSFIIALCFQGRKNGVDLSLVVFFIDSKCLSRLSNLCSTWSFENDMRYVCSKCFAWQWKLRFLWN